MLEGEFGGKERKVSITVGTGLMGRPRIVRSLARCECKKSTHEFIFIGGNGESLPLVVLWCAPVAITASILCLAVAAVLVVLNWQTRYMSHLSRHEVTVSCITA